MARSDDVSQHYPPLSNGEESDCTSDLRWRKHMLAQAKRQSLALGKIVTLLEGQGATLEEVRDHFQSWAVEES